MNDALYVAATGMKAQHAQLEAIANNVANVQTPGFKRGAVAFAELVAATSRDVDAVAPDAGPAGVAAGAVQRRAVAGELRPVDDPMALAIQGDGFLEVLTRDGGAAFWRGGALSVNADRLLATAAGDPLRQRIHVPADLHRPTVAPDGEVSAVDDRGRSVPLGRLDLTLFANPAALRPLGDGLYGAPAAAGEPLTATPGEAGAGLLRQGQVEMSNVKLVDEMVQLLVAQRAYEMNVKVIQAADELAGMANGLRR